MACENIDDLLDRLEIIIDTGGELMAHRMNQIETLKMELRFLRTFIKFQQLDLSDPVAKITKKIRFIKDIHHLVFDGATEESKHNFDVDNKIYQMWDIRRSLQSFLLSAPDLLEYLDCLHRNLDDLPSYLVSPDLSFIKEIKRWKEHSKYRVYACFLSMPNQTSRAQIRKICFSDLDASKLTIPKFPKVYSSFLEDGLKQLKNKVPNRLINGHTLSSFFGRVEVLMSEITTTLPTLRSSSNDMNLETSNILEKVKLFKADVKQIFCRKLKNSIPSYFPMINELGFVDFLFRKLDEVLNSNGSLESLIKPDIRTLSKKLSHLISFIGNGECRILQELWRRSISAAYEVERHVDSILVRCNALRHLLFTLPSALKEIELSNKEFVEVSGSSLSMGSSCVAKPSPLISTRSGNIVVSSL
ncbi:hypothetical protein K7X08_025745 [Anisodus acutangulus]|uniref:Uncharacterized protein n=1 Tax=Anisodus acutangulus TaxID=402998 RepID=A0A9Q1LBV0_9SOLA|nr:hypothetical protein K7X08_025745 [Anisodus acutangulus]